MLGALSLHPALFARVACGAALTLGLAVAVPAVPVATADSPPHRHSGSGGPVTADSKSSSRIHNGRITFGRVDPAQGAHSLWVADAEGRHQQRLTQDPTGFSDWSPDGTRIAFDFADETGVHLATIRPNGTGRRNLTSAPGIQEVPSWSPDGRSIAFDAFDPAQPVFRTSIWVMRADGTRQRQLTTDGFDVEPAFSPDGERIVFGRIVENLPADAPQEESVYVVNVDGTGLREVVPPTPGLEHPDWSPDGRSITFNIAPEGDGPDAGSVFSVRPSGQHLRVLVPATSRVGFFKAKWSPDGRQLLMGCFDRRIGRDQLCTSSARGNHVRIVPLGGDTPLNFPAWGPRPRNHR